MTFRLNILLLLAALLWGCPAPEEDDPEPEPEGEWAQAFDATGFWLLSVGGASDDLYAVGGSPTEGRIQRFDGSEWANEDVSALQVPLLNWVHRFDDGTTFVAGNDGTILRGDEAGWELMETPTDEDLWGIWGASPDDIWAVGGRGTSDSERIALRYDGTAWTSVAVPLQRPGVNAFFKVWGTAADNVWIVGQNGAIVQWNGTEFVETGLGTARDLISVWGTGPDDVYVVGGRGNGIIGRWNGEEWTSADLAPAPGLNGVWASADNGVWVAGARGTLREVTVEEDGSLTVVRVPPISTLDLHAVFGTDDGTLVTVGGNFQQPQGPYEGVALQNQPEDQP